MIVPSWHDLFKFAKLHFFVRDLPSRRTQFCRQSYPRTTSFLNLFGQKIRGLSGRANFISRSVRRECIMRNHWEGNNYCSRYTSDTRFFLPFPLFSRPHGVPLLPRHSWFSYAPTTRHFIPIQMAWARNTRIGCGSSECPELGGRFMVCNYLPG